MKVRPGSLLLSVTIAVVTAGITAVAQDLWPWPTAPRKSTSDVVVAPRVPVMQGDTIDDPFIIPGIPFTTTGNTCAFNHDYNRACPYSSSQAKDVVYRYECSADRAVTIDLCESTYDTKVYVFEDAAGNAIACNDDYCNEQSHIHQAPFAAGHTYYVVVDGYDAAACGDYALTVEEYIPCVVECPAGAMPEGEPECHDNYNDNYNYGCHTPNMFQVLELSVDPIVICGTTGVFMIDTMTYRDGDWYEINLTEPSEICLSGDAEVPMWFMIADGRGGCGDFHVVAYASVGECSPVSDLCYDCGAGTWWIVLTPNAWDLSYPCGSVYWMEITGYTPGSSGVPEEGPGHGTTWGRVKDLYR
jgi:hypothetical protein